MAVAKGFVLDGDVEVQRTLGKLAVREGRNINRSTVHELARMIRDDARKNMASFSKTGTLKRAIVARRRRPRDPDKPYSDVNVTRGAGAKYDAFYWRFIEYGTSTGLPARRIFGKAIDAIAPEIPQLYRKIFFRRLAQKLRKG